MMENPYEYDRTAPPLRSQATQRLMCRAWEECEAAIKVEQTEIVSSLLLVANTVVRYYHRRQDHIVPSHLIDSLEQLVTKAGG